MFALSGVAGSGLAYGEIRMPYAVMLFPGVAFCILGVFAISHKRDERIAQGLHARSRKERRRRCMIRRMEVVAACRPLAAAAQRVARTTALCGIRAVRAVGALPIIA